MLHALGNCEFGTEVENNIRDQLVSKHQSTDLRRRLLIEKNLTLQSALEIARFMESADRQTKGSTVVVLQIKMVIP